MNTNSSAGFRQKPKSVYLAAIVLMLAPIGNLAMNLAVLGVPRWYHPENWIFWTRYVSPLTWGVLALIFLTGVSLLFVRRWTWTFSIISMALIIAYDVIMWNEFQKMGLWAVVAMILGTIAFIAFLIFTEFRVPYLNPRARWWETSPRYRVDLPVGLSKTDTPATLIDISRSGVLVEWMPGQTRPELEGNIEITLPTQAKVPATVMRKTERGYGMSFVGLNGVQKKSVKTFIETLAEDPTKLHR